MNSRMFYPDARQSQAIAQFRSAIPVSQGEAITILMNANWDVTKAIRKTRGPSRELKALWASLQISPGDTPETLSVDSTMNYLVNILEVDLETAEMFVALEALKAPNIGSITVEGFFELWSDLGVGSTFPGQAAYLKSRTASLATDRALFTRVYRHVFTAGREPDQKALPIDTALLYWSILFVPPGLQWKSGDRDWLAIWTTYLQENHARSVNKDMWYQTLEFAYKSMEGDKADLAFWNEEASWPSVIDEFVQWFYSKYGDPRAEDDDYLDI